MSQNELIKLLGVKTNHGVEYFGGPAAPTYQFSHNQWFLHNLAKIASELSFFRLEKQNIANVE